jgi:hypothetical protein
MSQRQLIPPAKPSPRLAEPGDLTEILRAALQIDNRAEFLNVALSIWRKVHPSGHRNQGGRPTLQQQAFEVCEIVWAKTPPANRQPTLYWMCQRVAQRWLKPNGTPHAPATIQKHVKHWFQARRRLDEFDAEWFHSQRWVLALADYSDNHICTNRALVNFLDRHPIPQSFRADGQAFRDDPQTMLTFLDSLRHPTSPDYRPFSSK